MFLVQFLTLTVSIANLTEAEIIVRKLVSYFFINGLTVFNQISKSLLDILTKFQNPGASKLHSRRWFSQCWWRFSKNIRIHNRFLLFCRKRNKNTYMPTAATTSSRETYWDIVRHLRRYCLVGFNRVYWIFNCKT